MFNGTGEYSLSDIAAVTGSNNQNGSNDAWGDGGAWQRSATL